MRAYGLRCTAEPCKCCLSIGRQCRSTACRPQSRSRNTLLRALANRELKRWDVVEQVTRQLIAATPRDQLSNELLGESLHRQRKYQEAACVYEELLRGGEHKGVSTASLHIRLAKLLMDQGDRTGAARHLEQARISSPEHAVESETHQKRCCSKVAVCVHHEFLMQCSYDLHMGLLEFGPLSNGQDGDPD